METVWDACAGCVKVREVNAGYETYSNENCSGDDKIS